ncbi:hypothetical protein [Tritonibacter scottomollicae]|uniref:hypothetical protein n=1 Tax=Tritonibacter scottomollicae TaxID=483013 RepID=UPI003AA7CED2
MIAKLMLVACFLIEETSPELAMPIASASEALEARIVVAERAAEELGMIAATARAILRMV